MISAKEYLENPDIFKQSLEALAERCANPECKVILSGTVTGRKKCADGFMCEDCYFDELGKEVETHPIGRRSV